eukprot:CAMPEP_0178421264 /NCGR_PEP_ID=MMETSP0689_2-20121128/26558_1 /TAXON_ID=160604 /ORGANISM="Amphidinium massartii, Strain CS-259" /LENGTH=362 /DNA_ID=CAMNT_0020042771 /DNA_START=414 /DNA_END=1499 /DNA_ORIENTATION=+
MSLTVLVTEQLGPVPTELQTSDVKEGLFSEACTCEDVVPGATPAVPLWDTVVLPVSRRPVVEIGGSSVTQSSLVFNAEAIAAVMSASVGATCRVYRNQIQVKSMTVLLQSTFVVVTDVVDVLVSELVVDVFVELGWAVVVVFEAFWSVVVVMFSSVVVTFSSVVVMLSSAVVLLTKSDELVAAPVDSAVVVLPSISVVDVMTSADEVVVAAPVVVVAAPVVVVTAPVVVVTAPVVVVAAPVVVVAAPVVVVAAPVVVVAAPVVVVAAPVVVVAAIVAVVVAAAVVVTASVVVSAAVVVASVVLPVVPVEGVVGVDLEVLVLVVSVAPVVKDGSTTDDSTSTTKAHLVPNITHPLLTCLGDYW